MKIYRLNFTDKEEALAVKELLLTSGHTAINMTGYGSQTITPEIIDEEGNVTPPVIDDSYFAMIATNEDELIDGLEDYVTDVDYFKPVYAGQQNENNVVKPEDYV